MKSNLSICLVLGVLFGGFVPPQTNAAVILYDSASQPAYADGWQAGDNGGSGLGPWQDPLSIGGMFIGSAVGNGSTQPQTIDTAGVSWELLPGSFVQRSILAPVGVGSTLSISYDSGIRAESFTSVSVFSDFTSATVNAGIDGGQYTLQTLDGRFGTGVLANENGVILKFTILEASDDFSTEGRIRMSVTPSGGSEIAIEQRFYGNALTRIRFQGGSGSDPAVYINEITAVTAVPEPGHISVAIALGLAVFGVVRWRK